MNRNDSGVTSADLDALTRRLDRLEDRLTGSHAHQNRQVDSLADRVRRLESLQDAGDVSLKVSDATLKPDDPVTEVGGVSVVSHGETLSDPLLTIPQVLDYLGGAISETTVRRLIAAGTLRTVRIGRVIRVRVSAVEDYLKGAEQ